jgi:hypothetical protein
MQRDRLELFDLTLVESMGGANLLIFKIIIKFDYE